MNRYRTSTHRVTAPFLLCASLVLTTACESRPKPHLNDPPSVNAEASDADAVRMAQRTLDAMGGADAWSDTRYFRWTFFGESRTHYWDKRTGRARVEMHGRNGGPDTIVLFNVNTKEGRSFVGGEEVTDAAAAEQNLKRAYGAWINDGYWLFMPYKLMDPGVTLRGLGGVRLDDKRIAQRLELTFDSVGLTPQNKYHVDIALDTGLVAQWSFFSTADAQEPRFIMPWANWQHYGPIMLSDGRGDGRALINVAVYAALPDLVFECPAPIDDSTLEPYDVTARR